jgi:hypothetical protein
MVENRKCINCIYSTPTNGLTLNHNSSISLFDLGLQHDQVSAASPIMQRKYFNIALTFLILRVHYEMYGGTAEHVRTEGDLFGKKLFPF